MHTTHESDDATPEVTLARMQAVVAVARTQSFGAAAVALGVSQSGVSRAVATVEAALDVVLFDRSTRRVSLTDRGREFVDRAEVVLSDVRAAIDAVRPAPDAAGAAHTAIACLMSVAPTLLAPALGRLGVDGPRRVHVAELFQDSIELQVRTGTADLGIGDLRDLPADLRGRALWTEEAMVCLPADHPLAERRRLVLGDLAGEDLVTFPRDARLRVTVDRALAEQGQLRAPRATVQHYDTALALVAAGWGLLVAPACATYTLPTGLRAVPLAEPGTRRVVGGIWRPSTPPTAPLERVLDALAAEAAGRPHLRLERVPRRPRPSTPGRSSRAADATRR